jgi:hypothetical protein
MGVRVFAEMEDFIRPILIPRLELPPEVIQDLDRGDQRLLQTVWQHLYEYACTEKMSDADPGVEAEIELRHTAEEEMPEIVLTIYYSPLKRRITADRTNKIAVHGTTSLHTLRAITRVVRT